MENEELMLITRAKQGDMQAFEEIVLKYQKKVYNIAYSKLNNQEDAFDVAQDVFVKVFKSLNKFNESSAFSTWLYRITFNTCLDLLRKRMKLKSMDVVSINKELDDNGNELEIPDVRQGPEDAAINSEKMRLVNEAIAKLPEDQRNMIILRDINGLSYDEIANTLDMSLGTVKSRINRARSALKNILQNNLGLFM